MNYVSCSLSRVQFTSGYQCINRNYLSEIGREPTVADYLIRRLLGRFGVTRQLRVRRLFSGTLGLGGSLFHALSSSVCE